MGTQIALLTTSEVANKFAVDPSTVRLWVHKKQLQPSLRTPGGQYRFDPAEIERFRVGHSEQTHD